MSFVLCGPLSVSNPHLTASFPLSPTLSFSSQSFTPLPASCALCLLPTFQRLHPAILRKPKPFSCNRHSVLSLFYFCFGHPLFLHFPVSISSTCTLHWIILLSSLPLSSLRLLPLSPSHSSLYPCRLRGNLRSQRSHDHQPYRFPATPDVLVPSHSISSEV